jgi:hypothetical protein
MPRLFSLVFSWKDFFIKTFPSKDEIALFFHATMIPVSLQVFVKLMVAFLDEGLVFGMIAVGGRIHWMSMGGVGWTRLSTPRSQPDSLFGNLGTAHACHVGLVLLSFVVWNFSGWEVGFPEFASFSAFPFGMETGAHKSA